MNRIPVQFRITRGLQLLLISAMGLAIVFGTSNVKMVLFVAGVSFVSIMFCINRMLRYRDSSEVAPAHVRAAVDTLAEGLLIMDQDGQIALANRAFGNVVGRQPEALIGLSASSLHWQTQTANGSVDATTLPWHRAIESNEPLYNTTLLLADSSGVNRTFIVNCSPVVGARGKVRGALASFEDVTSRVQKETELRKSQEAAEEANQAKSELLARMNDEIGTPVKAILCFMDYLRRRYEEDDKEHHELLNTMHSSTQQLQELINQIPGVSKIESGKPSFTLRTFAGHVSELSQGQPVPAAKKQPASALGAQLLPDRKVQSPPVAQTQTARDAKAQWVRPAEVQTPSPAIVQAVPPAQPHSAPAVSKAASRPLPAEPLKTRQATNAIPPKLHTTLSIDDPDYLELVQEFVDRLQDQLGKMQDAWDQRELGELARLAHWLKGSGHTHGFPMFTDPAATLEKLASEKRIEDINAALADVCDLGRRVIRPRASRREAAEHSRTPAAKAHAVLAIHAQALPAAKVRAVHRAQTHKETTPTKSHARAIPKSAQFGQAKNAKRLEVNSALPKPRKANKRSTVKKLAEAKRTKGIKAARADGRDLTRKVTRPKAKRPKGAKRRKK
jgi:PAS domain S-box-containing protein